MRGAVHQHLRHFGATKGDTLLLATRLGQLLNHLGKLLICECLKRGCPNIPSPADLQQGTHSDFVTRSLHNNHAVVLSHNCVAACLLTPSRCNGFFPLCNPTRGFLDALDPLVCIIH